VEVEVGREGRSDGRSLTWLSLKTDEGKRENGRERGSHARPRQIKAGPPRMRGGPRETERKEKRILLKGREKKMKTG